jgi:hypothetical protein
MPVAEDFNADDLASDIPDFAVTSLFGVDATVAQAPVRIRGGEIGHADAPEVPIDQRAVDTTLGQTIQDFWHLPPGSDALKSYQQELFDAGLYPDAYYRAKNPKKLNLGVADDVDAKAWKDIALLAARTGRPVMDLIAERKAAYLAQGGIQAAKKQEAASGAAPFSATVANPLTLAEVAQKAAETTLGRGFTQAELDRFVKSYQAMQVNAQRGEYDTAISGGTATAAPDPTAAATQQARQSAPTEAFANDLMNVYDRAMAILTRRPGGGG